MTNEEIIRNRFNFIDPQIVVDILEFGIVKEFEANTEIIKEGQYIRSVPVVLKGLVKVFSRYEEKELLLYHYIKKVKVKKKPQHIQYTYIHGHVSVVSGSVDYFDL